MDVSLRLLPADLQRGNPTQYDTVMHGLDRNVQAVAGNPEY